MSGRLLFVTYRGRIGSPGVEGREWRGEMFLSFNKPVQGPEEKEELEKEIRGHICNGAHIPELRVYLTGWQRAEASE